MAQDMTHSHPHADPHQRAQAFDPALQPELFEGVRTKRVFAFFIDVIAVSILVAIAAVVIAILGIFTLGLAWFVYPLLWQGVAILYTAVTLGGSASATPGMRATGLEMRLWHGGPMYPLLAIVHVVLFWVTVGLVTPLVVLVSLFSSRKRLLHDIILGTVVINARNPR